MSKMSLLVVLLGIVVLATPSTSTRLLSNSPELSPVEQLYVEAQAVIDTLKEEAIKRHLAPLASKVGEGQAAEIQEDVKNYIDEALSPSGLLEIDNEVQRLFDAGLPPSEMLDTEEKPENYGDFAASPLGKMDAEEIKSIDELAEKFSGSALSPSGGEENQDENSLAPSRTGNFDVDQEVENYHNFALSPSDRLEEIAVEMPNEVQETYSTTP